MSRRDPWPTDRPHDPWSQVDVAADAYRAGLVVVGLNDGRVAGQADHDEADRGGVDR